MNKTSDERLEKLLERRSDVKIREIIAVLETQAAMTDGYDWDLLSALRELLALREQTRLHPGDECSCGHARHIHEYGAFDYNAASNCNKCECSHFAAPVPSVQEVENG